jgi:hypothetical protein
MQLGWQAWLSALHGIKVVIRQSLYNGHYALISKDYHPSPVQNKFHLLNSLCYCISLQDYWLSLLHKSLMGRKVLAVTGSTSRVRMYAHCTATMPRFQISHYDAVYETEICNNSPLRSHMTMQYQPGSVAVMVINLRNHTSHLSFQSNLAQAEKHLYWLTPHGPKGLVSK